MEIVSTSRCWCGLVIDSFKILRHTIILRSANIQEDEQRKARGILGKSGCNLTLPAHLNRVSAARKNLRKISSWRIRIECPLARPGESAEVQMHEVTRRFPNGSTLQYPHSLPCSAGFVVRLRRQHVCGSGRRDDHVRAGPRRQRQRLSRRRSWLLSRWPWLLSRPGIWLLWRARSRSSGPSLLVERLRPAHLPMVI